MFWFFAILAILLIIIWVMYYSRPTVFAKTTATTQLKVFRSSQQKFPDFSKEELYSKVLSSRPTYQSSDISQIMEQAHKRANGQPLTFRNVVAALIWYEYFKLRGAGGRADDIQNLVAMGLVVDKVIPPDL